MIMRMIINEMDGMDEMDGWDGMDEMDEMDGWDGWDGWMGWDGWDGVGWMGWEGWDGMDPPPIYIYIYIFFYKVECTYYATQRICSKDTPDDVPTIDTESANCWVPAVVACRCQVNRRND